ncbi:unnamed protein product [Sphenostylis stenocarpa]|uniref:DUF6821 domain-containing protein n=1 Tax=Sphenostylis stenocarpa TaxID=92480 RepID=A0AA86VMG5_9FABA|nr:unnamed protein product [Sphenostylis stenocarpa]
MDAQFEVEDWEFLHPNEDVLVPVPFAPPTLQPIHPIRPDHFSLLPVDHHPNPNSDSNSNSTSSSNSNSEVDRNFDDSYVANQLFPNPTAPWTADSDSDTVTAGTMPGAEIVPVENLKAEEEDREEEEVKEEMEEEKRLVWWKVPFEVLKCWVNPLPLPLPVWSLSVAAAAAFLGLFFLGRRLYRMKRKSQTLKLNLALDDKKVSQLMGRVARLNEAFSVVRRVPIVRPPSLPASSVTLRPVMSMR